MNKFYRRFGIAAFGLAMAMSVSAGHALDALISADANMHIGPGADFPIVGVVPNEADVRVNGCTSGEGWCVVRHNGRHGWVASASVSVTGISRSRNKFDDPIIVINVAEQPGGRVFRGLGAAAVPVIVEQEGAAVRNGRRVFRSGVGVAEPVPAGIPDFTVIKVK
jgi:uncharacterized protein YgiM (DUF1202 family)